MEGIKYFHCIPAIQFQLELIPHRTYTRIIKGISLFGEKRQESCVTECAM